MDRTFVVSALFILSLALLVGAVIWSSKNTYNLTQQECSDPSRWPASCRNDSSCCLVWDNDAETCRKGTRNGNECVSKGNVGPLILMILGVVAFIACIVLLFAWRNQQ